MNINKTRSAMYLVAKLLGDLNAVLKGRIFRRIGVRVVGKALGRMMGRMSN